MGRYNVIVYHGMENRARQKIDKRREYILQCACWARRKYGAAVTRLHAQTIRGIAPKKELEK